MVEENLVAYGIVQINILYNGSRESCSLWDRPDIVQVLVIIVIFVLVVIIIFVMILIIRVFGT